MKEMKKMSTRESYGKTLEKLGEEYANLLVLDADLVGATKTGYFQKSYPDRHFDCGIAEANMMGVAAGLACEGFIPVVSTFAMFASGRAYEQVRNSIGYPHLNVKIIATHGGVSVGEDGATHQCNEDIALMRSIPGMTVVCPSDAVETEMAVRAVMQYEGPVYVRLGRADIPVFNDKETAPFTLGKGICLREGETVSLIATGLCVYEALRAAEILEKQGVQAEVINISTIKPLDKELIVRSAQKTGKVVTVEEHSTIGGLGSAVCEALCENAPVPVLKIGIPDVYGKSGTAAELLDHFGLTGEKIAQSVLRFLEKK
jgi:transketolase